MSAPVTDRLQRLAEHAPSHLGDPDALWSQGRRRQRARWAGTAAVLVVLAVLGAVGVPRALQDSQTLVADTSSSELHLPDVVRQPGEWERAVFPDAPGRLVAVGIGTRGEWWSSRTVLWGVSAETGESRFLDLPDAVGSLEAHPALSADGRRLAYWFTGDTTGEPLRIDGLDPATGVAVLDLTTGEEMRWEVSTAHGMSPEGLAWAGDVVWWAGGRYLAGGTPTQYGAHVEAHAWQVEADDRSDLERQSAEARALLPGRAPGPAPDGVVSPARRGFRILGERGVSDVVETDLPMASSAAVSPDGTLVAGIHDVDPSVVTGEPDPLVVGEVGSGPTTMEPVGEVETTLVHGWRSADQVVVGTYRGDGTERVHGASAVDLETTEVTPLLDFRGNVPSFAADAWSAEVIEAPDAPWAPDPRLTAAFLLVLGAFVVSLVNSIRRRRGRA